MLYSFEGADLKGEAVCVKVRLTVASCKDLKKEKSFW
jgi:hypothetical protein